MNLSSNSGNANSYGIQYFNCDYSEISFTAKIGLIVCYPVIMITSLVGNFLVIFIVFTHKELKKTTNWFIVNMAVCDFMFPSIVIPAVLAEMVESSWPGAGGTSGLVLCKLMAFCTTVSLSVSVQSIVWIAFDRFVAVMYPMKAHFISARFRTIAIASTWFVAMGVNSVRLYFYQVLEVQSKFICTGGLDESFEYDSIYKIYLMVYTFVFQIAPFIALTVIYSVIAITLRKQDKRLDSGGNEGSKPKVRLRRHQAIKMSFFIMAAFYTCSFPLLVSALIWEFQISVSCSFLTTLLKMSVIMICLSSVVNPLICLTFVGSYREGLKKILRVRWKRQLRENNMDINVEGGITLQKITCT